MTDFTGLRVADRSTMRQESGTAQTVSQGEILASLLNATRDTLIRVTKLPKIPIIRSDAKAKAFMNLKDVVLPRGFLRFGNYTSLDRINSVSMNRRGYTSVVRTGDQTRKFNARVYPIQVQGEFHFLTDGGKTGHNMLSDILTLRAGRNLGFRVVISDAFEYMSQIQMEPSVSADDTEYASEDRKAMAEHVFPFMVEGWLGSIDMTVINLRTTIRSGVVNTQTPLEIALTELQQEQEALYGKNNRR